MTFIFRWLPYLFVFSLGKLLGQQVSLDALVPVWGKKNAPCFAEKDSIGIFALKTSNLDSLLVRTAQKDFFIVGQYAPMGILVLRGQTRAVRHFAESEPSVSWLECWPASIQEEAIVPGHNLYVNRFNTHTKTFPNVDGSNIHVSIKETRFDTTDVDFQNRIGPSPGAAPFISAHATQMATLVGGSGTSSPRAKGGAPGVFLHSSGLFSFLPDAPEQYDLLNIGVQNHSYGTDLENRYNLSAAAYDQSNQLRPTLLHVFSAGNNGGTQGASGINGFANLTGGFKTAKNALMVGAVDSTGRVWAYSSRGPTADGRIKPDIVAFGQNGTSDATALVSAAAALLQQQLQNQNGQLPPSALLRAILLSGADEVGTPGPDFESGFGNLNVYHATTIVNGKQYIQTAITKGTRHSFPFQVPTDRPLLKATLAWDDLPAAPDAVKALTNDLDCWLVGPNGQIHRPWAKPHWPDSLGAPAQRGVDTLNNVEQIAVQNPQAGTWTLWVDGAKLVSSEQSFASAWRVGDAMPFRWDFPRHGDVAAADKEALFYWDYAGAKGDKSTLSWRYVGDAIWQKITDTVDLSRQYCRWRVPNRTAAVQLRMDIGAASFLSDTFLIEPPLRLQMGFHCPDSLHFYWVRTAPVGVGYAVYGLGNRYLELLFITNDTFMVLDKKIYPQQRFSIRHRHSATLQGTPAPAPDIDRQGAGCYFNNFYGAINGSNIELTAILGTLHALDSILFEKQTITGEFVALAKSAPALIARVEDPQPRQGANRYRVVLKMSEGHRAYSDTISLFHTGPSLENLIFPNPFPATGGDLYWIATMPIEGEETFRLFDALGRQVLEEVPHFDALTAAFTLPSLPLGTYCFSIRRPHGTPVGGVLVVGK